MKNEKDLEVDGSANVLASLHLCLGRCGVSNVQEVLFELVLWNVGCGMIVQSLVHAGDVFGIVHSLGDVVAHHHDGTLPIEVGQHLVHLLLKSLVYIGVWLIKNQHIGLFNNGTCEQHALHLAAAELTYGSLLQVGKLHLLQYL